ncbi:MAG: hypothetical protein MUE30_17270, partial [Spirosomaceae bacterium]|nr:hypothetical protein [Spirosomataceae bacterium]
MILIDKTLSEDTLDLLVSLVRKLNEPLQVYAYDINVPNIFAAISSVVCSSGECIYLNAGNDDALEIRYKWFDSISSGDTYQISINNINPNKINSYQFFKENRGKFSHLLNCKNIEIYGREMIVQIADAKERAFLETHLGGIEA